MKQINQAILDQYLERLTEIRCRRDNYVKTLKDLDQMIEVISLLLESQSE